MYESALRLRSGTISTFKVTYIRTVDQMLKLLFSVSYYTQQPPPQRHLFFPLGPIAWGLCHRSSRDRGYGFAVVFFLDHDLGIMLDHATWDKRGHEWNGFLPASQP